MDLSAAYLEACPGATGGPALDASLASAIRRAKAAWPDLAVDAEAFARYLGARVPEAELDAARVEDLCAAFGCTLPGEAGIIIVEQRYFRDVDAALGKMGLDGERIGEVKQGLRRVLFVGDEGAPPRITEYRGTGPLSAWLRVTAMRAALKLLRKEGREKPLSDDAVLEARSAADDPELAYMKAAYRATFKEAFQEALDSLLPRERMLLKQQIVDGLSIDELGALYQQHRATAARHVAAAREKLLTRTRRTFMLRARISSDECESIMRLVRSQLDVSLHRRLKAG